MRIPRIYVPDTLTSGVTTVLPEQASHHLSKVLRMHVGRELIVFNGEGGEYNAVITDITKKHVAVDVNEFSDDDRESPLQLHLAIGVSRGERFEWVLQKATELGVTDITPLITERTEVKMNGDRGDKQYERWHNIIISACEQCQRNRLPNLHAPTSLQHLCETTDADLKYVLHHRDSQTLPTNATPQSVLLLIGPEGGLSEQEIALARSHHFSPLTLGPRVLRTETAPIASISLVQYLWGDL